MATKKQSQAEDTVEIATNTLGKGFSAMCHSPTKAAIFICSLIIAYYFVKNRETAYPDNPKVLLLFCLVPFLLLFVYASAAPKSFDEKFQDIRFQNAQGQVPQVLKKKKTKSERGEVLEYTFSSVGIPVYEWKRRKRELETALDCNIVSVNQDPQSKQRVVMKCMAAELAIPTMIEWDDKYISNDDFKLVIGQGLMDTVGFDFNKLPHALVAGQTGSGKSVILRCMLWQAIKKGAKLYIVDFKGGVEFDRVWENYATVVTDEESALQVVKHLQAEMKLRLALFREENCKNLKDYNKKHPEAPLCRIILGCDEVAEMLDVEGLSKDEKAAKGELSQGLASLARLSRAAGINMILGMQRPDAKVLKGQIKNNTPIRICGQFADESASMIVLGNGLAAQLPDIRGRFLYNIGADTYEFQAYMFDDDALIPGNWQIGRTLNNDPLEVEKDVALDEQDIEMFDVPSSERADWNNEDDDWMFVQ